MTITRYFNLNLNAGQSSPLTINVNQYDSGEQWVFTLYGDNGLKFTPATGAIVGVKSDGLGIINTGTVDSDGRVVINETQQMTAAAGRAVFELMLDSQTHGTANFVVLVEPKPGDHADLSDSDVSLIQQAIDSTIPENIAGAVSDWMDDNLAPSQWVLDSSLSVQGAAADAKAAGDKIDRYITLIDVVPTNEYPYIKFRQTYTDGTLSEVNVAANSTMVAVNNKIGNLLNLQTTAKNNVVSAINELNSNSLSNEVKQALLAMFRKCVFLDGGDEAYDALEAALYPPANLLYITAVYTQSGTVYNTDTLDSLKSDLVVTANYDNGTSETVTAYTLSGTLTEGTSTIVVAYGGKSTTFNVTVTAAWNYEWTYTDGTLADNGWVLAASGGTTTMESDGLLLTSNTSGSNTLNYTNATYVGVNTISEYEFKPITIGSVSGSSSVIFGITDDGTKGAKQIIYNDNKLYMVEGSTNVVIPNVTLTLNEWHKVRIEYLSSGVTVFFDDTQVYSSTSVATSYISKTNIAVVRGASMKLRAVRFRRVS